MRKDEKVLEVKNLSERFEKAKALIFTAFRGLKVSEITELRRKLRQNQSTLKVVKNRLVKRILKERGLEGLSGHFTDPTAIASSDADPVSPAKILVEFAKGHDKLVLKGGLMGTSLLSASDVETLARIPSREVLLSRALASMNAPATNFACALAAIPRKLVCAINAIREKKAN